MLPLKVLVRVVMWCLGYLWVEVRGAPAPRSVAPIVLCNHVSLVDPVVMLFLTGGMPVSAAENLHLPLIGPTLIALQALLVVRDRSAVSHAEDAGGSGTAHAAGTAPAKGDAASAALSAAAPLPPPSRPMTHAPPSHAPPATQPGPSADINDKISWRAWHNAYPRLLIFPEGTTTNGSGLLSFRSGAFRPGLPVQPAIVRYPRDGLDPSWVSDGPAFLGISGALMSELSNRAVVEFLPPYIPSAAERADPELYAANVQAAMAAALGVPSTQHTYEDIQLSLEAVKADYPVDASVVEFNEVRRATAARLVPRSTPRAPSPRLPRASSSSRSLARSLAHSPRRSSARPSS